jgi:hypothetical protein
MSKFIYALFFIVSVSFNSKAQIFQWAKSLGGTGTDEGMAIATDAAGNVYSTGSFSGTMNFTVGSSPSGFTSTGPSDLYIFKHNPAGNCVWAEHFGGPLAEKGTAIAVDAAGNIYITGIFTGTLNYGGVSSTTIASAGMNDMFVAKFYPSGLMDWIGRMGGTMEDAIRSIDIDAGGDIYVAGDFQGTADLHPGLPQYLYSSWNGSRDCFVMRIAADMSGGGPSFPCISPQDDYGYSVDVGASNVAYFTGSNATSGTGNISIAKINTSLMGPPSWTTVINTSGGSGTSVIVDPTGNYAYAAGYFQGAGDFNFSAGTSSLTSNGNKDIFILKIAVATNSFVWAKNIGGTDDDVINAMRCDASGNIYTTGYFSNAVDFDPGNGTFFLATPTGARDAFISKLNVAGNFIWAGQLGGSTQDYGNSIAVDASNNVHSTGHFTGTGDFDPGAGSFVMTTTAAGNIYLHKLSCSGGPAISGGISGNSTVCSGVTNTYSVSPVVGATSYAWTLPSGWTGNSSTNIISATPGTSGTFSVTASNECATGAQQILNVTVSPCTGVSEFINDTQLNVFPNPFHEKFTIRSDKNETISIQNILGALVKTISVEEGTTEVDIKDQPAGIYFVKIENGACKKIIKE